MPQPMRAIRHGGERRPAHRTTQKLRLTAERLSRTSLTLPVLSIVATCKARLQDRTPYVSLQIRIVIGVVLTAFEFESDCTGHMMLTTSKTSKYSSNRPSGS